MWPWARQHGQPLETVPLKSPERTQPHWPLYFSPIRTISDFWHPVVLHNKFRLFKATKVCDNLSQQTQESDTVLFHSIGSLGNFTFTHGFNDHLQDVSPPKFSLEYPTASLTSVTGHARTIPNSNGPQLNPCLNPNPTCFSSCILSLLMAASCTHSPTQSI